MAKIVQLHGQRPGGWAKERWAWIGAVMAAPDLNATAKLIAVALAQGFANNETAECRPGLPALMAAICAPKRTVMQALADLRQAGWIDTAGGNAPGRAAAYAFRWPGQVQNPAPEQVPNPAPEQVQKTASTGAENCTPPCTPYKDKPHMNHKPWPRGATRIYVDGGGRPTQLSQVVQKGTPGEADWNRWLADQGFPPLDRMGRVIVVGMLEGWDMPWRFPPSPGDSTATRVGLAYAKWLTSKA